MIKVIITSLRTFNNYDVVEDVVVHYFMDHNIPRKDVEIISAALGVRE